MIKTAALSSHIPGEELSSFHFPVTKNGEKIRIIAYNIKVDPEYFDLMNMTFLNGQGFNPESNNTNKVLMNQAMMKKCGFTENIVGKQFNQYKISGIIKDVHFNSLHTHLKPMAFFSASEVQQGYMNIRLATSDLRSAMDYIKQSFRNFYPHLPYHYSFLDKTIEKMYETEKKHGIFLNAFAILSILIACIGLLGISITSGKLRIKEIGIRKVNGAKIPQILKLLNSDFLILIAIAFVIACPIAWYAMKRWLQNFAYKTEISWWIFALAGVIALGVALLTVSWQSWRAARRNPVEALRYE